jgi:uncharacterized protein YuzB (UPF0349 family)
MGIVIVEVCDVNSASGLDLEQLETEFPGVSVMRTPCLSNCTQCAVVPFAYVNGEILTAPDKETLLSNIKQAIQVELAEWDV